MSSTTTKIRVRAFDYTKDYPDLVPDWYWYWSCPEHPFSGSSFPSSREAFWTLRDHLNALH